MKRLTVTFRMPEDAEDRHWHPEARHAEAFAAKVRADGGVAEIGPFSPGPDLTSLFKRLGVAPRSPRVSVPVESTTWKIKSSGPSLKK